MKKSETDSLQTIRIAVETIADKKGYDITEFHTAKSSVLADYVIIASGLNAPHLKALANAIMVSLKKEGRACYRKSGEPDSGWIVMDYLDIIIHFFTPEQREYYNLDAILKK